MAPGLDILLLSIDDGGIAGSAHSDRVGVRVAVSVESARVRSLLGGGRCAWRSGPSQLRCGQRMPRRARIVPPRTQYWVCTVEAMPEGMGTDFLAVDEIQLCADPERGRQGGRALGVAAVEPPAI